MGLGEFLKGYIEGQELHMKKAREVADKAAEEWTRQFQVQQAKDKAAQQEITNRLEERRVATEEQQAKLREKTLEETERKNKAAEEFRKTSFDMKSKLDAAKTDFKKWQTVWQSYLKERDQLIFKGDLDPRIANDLTQWMLSETDANIVGPQGQGAPVPMPGTQPQQQAPPQGTGILGTEGNPLAAIVQQMQGPSQGHMPGRYSVNPPAEGMPAAGGSMLPGQAAALALQKAKEGQALATADLQKSKTKTEDMLRAANEDAKKSLSSLHKAQVDHVKAETNRINKMLGKELEKKTAEINHLVNQDKKIINDIDDSKKKLNIEETKLAAEYAITGVRGLTTAEKARILNLQSQQWRDFNAESKHLEHLNLSMAAYQAAVRAPATDKTVTEVQRAAAKAMIPVLQMDIVSSESQLKDKKAAYDEASDWVAQLNLRAATKPGGAKDPKAQKANQGATSRDAKASARKANVRPAPVIPPGAPVPPGAQPGLYARPGHGTTSRDAPAPRSTPPRSAPPAKKEIKKKKPTADELRRKYGL